MHELTPGMIDRLLDELPVARIGVISDGEPYVSALNFVYSEGVLYFRTTPTGRRAGALRENPRVCVEVSRFDAGTARWASVIGFGDAAEVTDEAEIARVERALREKYRRLSASAVYLPEWMEPQHGVVVAVPLTRLSGRGSGGTLEGQSFPGRL